ncbi:hypothetical protein GOV05_02525 [Candidatus Woesearchaeota archaeon]|nr:hypothetical protein [Candidatus Woesearchaeota archaeon]
MPLSEYQERIVKPFVSSIPRILRADMKPGYMVLNIDGGLDFIVTSEAKNRVYLAKIEQPSNSSEVLGTQNLKELTPVYFTSQPFSKEDGILEAKLADRSIAAAHIFLQSKRGIRNGKVIQSIVENPTHQKVVYHGEPLQEESTIGIHILRLFEMARNSGVPYQTLDDKFLIKA